MKRIVCVLIMITILIPSIALAQERPHEKNWVRGKVTAFTKSSITIEGKRYRFEPLMTITDLDGNTLTVRSLRSAEVVKAFVLDKWVKKIVILVRRE
jgi:uncharacterized membrane protein